MYAYAANGVGKQGANLVQGLPPEGLVAQVELLHLHHVLRLCIYMHVHIHLYSVRCSSFISITFCVYVCICIYTSICVNVCMCICING